VTEPIVLYDAECSFCRWSLAKLLAWDRGRRLRVIALQEPDAVRLLPGMSEEERMASWHLVDPSSGEVRSAGAAFPPMLRLLPGGRPFAGLAAAFPRLTDRAYHWVSRHRGKIGRLIPRASRERATRRIRERTTTVSRETASPQAAAVRDA
jgi:predicted DCC family thiol-disulfide oxidoreductase YuxK